MAATNFLVFLASLSLMSLVSCDFPKCDLAIERECIQLGGGCQVTAPAADVLCDCYKIVEECLAKNNCTNTSSYYTIYVTGCFLYDCKCSSLQSLYP